MRMADYKKIGKQEVISILVCVLVTLLVSRSDQAIIIIVVYHNLWVYCVCRKLSV